MKISSFLVFAVLFTFGSISIAKANWQYTRWGMTPDQVVHASKGTASEVPFDPQTSINGLKCVVQGTYQSGSQLFSLSACFDDQGLQMIALSISTGVTLGEIQEFSSALSAKYGTGTPGGSSGILPTTIWTDQKDGNQIELEDLTSIGQLMILYTPLAAGNGL